MTMPGKPAAPSGAEGQINVPSPFEAPEPAGLVCEGGDDRIDVPVGNPKQQDPNSPTHGAAGGLDVNFTDVAPDLFTPAATSSGISTKHPAFGGAIAADSGMK